MTIFVSSTMDAEMYVTKRDGSRETVSFDKILQRIKNTGQEVGIQLNYTTLAMKVIDQLYDGISATKIDELTAEQCASLASTHPDYNTLAGRIIVSNHQKNTTCSFVAAMTKLFNYQDKHGKHSPLVSDQLYQVVVDHAVELDAMCDYSRDYLIDYFGFKTLDRAYMMKLNKVTVERPQHMWLRTAIGIHGADLPRVKETYDGMSQKYFTHATPTLFNSGTPHPQLSSCFLLSLEKDSIEGIYNTLKDCAMISKWAGGIGLHIHNLRASGSHIRGTNGSSNGIVPMLRVFNNTAKYVDQCLHPDTLLYTPNGPLSISECVAGQTKVFHMKDTQEFNTREDQDMAYASEDEYDTVNDGENMERQVAEQFVDSAVKAYDKIKNAIYPNEKIFEDVSNEKMGSETIEAVLEHSYEGPILSIRTSLPVKPLTVTPEHPLYAVSKINCGEQYQEMRYETPQWQEAKEIEKGDWIIYPVPKEIHDHVQLTEDVCYLYGAILYGMYKFNTTLSKTDYIVDPKRYYVIYENAIIENMLDLMGVLYIVDKENSVLSWESTVNLPFSRSDFYPLSKTGPKDVSIGSRFTMLPLNKTQMLLEGLNIKSWMFTGVRNKLMESAVFQYLRMGELEQCVHPALQNTVLYRDDETYMVQVQTVMDATYNGILYDLQMKNIHNYMANGGLVHNGGGKRNGSFAIYLEPWHSDIEAFLQMRKNHGDEELKARDLFYALWIPDLFMERVKADEQWTLMCPDECPGLADVYGEDFAKLYCKYEEEGKGRKSMKARALWFQILDAQMETGTPYLLYKDACNNKSNQKNLGTIKSSNLCTEVVQYSDDKESAVCNLASIALPSFVDPVSKTFDFEKLHAVTKTVTFNLNRVIDVNFYPTPKTERSNQRHRPIGLGVQGLADTFMLMDFAFTSEQAKKLNRDIFETIYHAALEMSMEIALQDGPYETFQGSPASQGKLQFDLWNVVPPNDRYDWQKMREDVAKNGLRNSLLVAPMPTASTSQILGFNECIEPITSNIYSRRTLAGEFIVANRYMMHDLMNLGLWNEKVKNNIIANHGSIQQIDVIPPEIREKYKTVWEMPMRTIIDMAADRGAYICQSQSLNLWIEDPTYATLTSMHFYSWSKGLKTGIYYLRRRGRHQAQQFTIEPEQAVNQPNQQFEEDDYEICESCSA